MIKDYAGIGSKVMSERLMSFLTNKKMKYLHNPTVAILRLAYPLAKINSLINSMGFKKTIYRLITNPRLKKIFTPFNLRKNTSLMELEP